MSASKAAILEALEQLASESDGGLEKKPNVKDIEAIVGGDVSAAERDEAWSEFVADDPSEEAESDDSADPEVTNNYTSPLAICGVTIPVGGSAVVPKFDAEKPLHKRWIDAEVISVK